MNTRIPEIEPGTRPELAQHEAHLLAVRGRISRLYRILMNCPDICMGWEQLLTAVRIKSSLNAALREMIILRVAVLNRASYEFEAHVPHALEAGVSIAKIDALKSPEPGAAFDAQERAVLRVTDSLTRDVSLSEEAFYQLRPFFDEGQLVEVLVTIASYNMVSRFLIAVNLVGKH